MALVTAEKFLERLEGENSLRTQLYISRPQTLAELTQFAHGKGFVVEAEELKQAIDAWKPTLNKGDLDPLKALVSGN